MIFGSDFTLPNKDKLQEIAAGVKDKVSPLCVNTLSAFNLSTSSMLRNTLMIDIETGGLSRWAPILQVAATNMSDSTGTNITNIFPVSIWKDMEKIDAKGGIRTHSYSIGADPILSL